MSTRSYIAKLNENGSITGIYCHHDGYPKGVGEMLKNNYTTLDKVNALLSLGDISSLGTGLNSGTLAYARDKGEKFNPNLTYTTLTEATKSVWSELGAEYTYVFDGTGWTYYDLNDPKTPKRI